MNKERNCHRWLKLLVSALVPLTIGALTITVTLLEASSSASQRQNENMEGRLMRAHSDRQAENLQKEKIYAAYLNDISQLLISENDPYRLTLVRAKTFATLRQLDIERRKQLFLFLYDIRLISCSDGQTASSLLKMDNANLNGLYFQGTIEVPCLFSDLYLPGIYLSEASFIKCHIEGANFSNSILYRTKFVETRLSHTHFTSAFLDKAIFNRAVLSIVSFFGASLVESNFTDANWIYKTIDFTSANLTGAVISGTLLERSILYNAILPDGRWGPIRTVNLVINGNAENKVSMHSIVIKRNEIQ